MPFCCRENKRPAHVQTFGWDSQEGKFFCFIYTTIPVTLAKKEMTDFSFLFFTFKMYDVYVSTLLQDLHDTTK